MGDSNDFAKCPPCFQASARPFNPTNGERSEALATALVTVLGRCAGRNKVVFALPTARAHYTGLGKYRSGNYG